MSQISVADAISEPPWPLSPEQPLDEVLDRFTTERVHGLPVIDRDGELLGVVALADVEKALTPSSDSPVIGSLSHQVPVLRLDDSLDDAIQALAESHQEGLPVLAGDAGEVVGWITHRGLLQAYHARRGEFVA